MIRLKMRLSEFLKLTSLFCVCRYVSILVELTRMEGTRHGRLIAAQMLDVAIRVQAIRPFAVSQMVREVLGLTIPCSCGHFLKPASFL